MDEKTLNELLECPNYKAQLDSCGKCSLNGSNCIVELGGHCDTLETEYAEKNVGG